MVRVEGAVVRLEGEGGVQAGGQGALGRRVGRRVGEGRWGAVWRGEVHLGVGWKGVEGRGAVGVQGWTVWRVGVSQEGGHRVGSLAGGVRVGGSQGEECREEVSQEEVRQGRWHLQGVVHQEGVYQGEVRRAGAHQVGLRPEEGRRAGGCQVGVRQEEGRQEGGAMGCRAVGCVAVECRVVVYQVAGCQAVERLAVGYRVVVYRVVVHLAAGCQAAECLAVECLAAGFRVVGCQGEAPLVVEHLATVCRRGETAHQESCCLRARMHGMKRRRRGNGNDSV